MVWLQQGHWWELSNTVIDLEPNDTAAAFNSRGLPFPAYQNSITFKLTDSFWIPLQDSCTKYIIWL